MGKSTAPPLLPIFRSRAQADLLARVMLAPGEHTSSTLSRDLGIPFSTVQREVNALVKAGVLQHRTVGRSKVVEPAKASAAYRPLRDLVMIAFGPRVVVEEEFAELAGLAGLYIFGSWAARYLGEEGTEPGDIDVLVVGRVDRGAAYDAADRAQQRIGREVNPTVVSEERWQTAEQPFLIEVRRRPLVTIVDADEHAGTEEAR